MIGAMVLALWVKVGAETAGDLITTMRASKAGEWSLIDKQRDRKAAASKNRREAVSKAWQATRTARNKKAGGTGQYRPGVWAYGKDVYHGLCEDGLEKRKAKRAARPPIGPNGKRPVADRLDDAFENKVNKQRAQTGYMGRAKQVGRLLVEPVGENRQPADVVPPTAARPGEGSGVKPDPFTPPAPVADGPRTACPVCGDTLTEHDGVWSHPAESTCETARRPDGGHPVPRKVAEQAADLYRANRAEGRSGALGETQTGRDLRGMFGDQYPQHVYEQAAADATQTRAPVGGWMPEHDKLTQAAHDALADADPDGHRTLRHMDDAYEAVCRAFPHIHPDAIGEVMAIADKTPGCNSCGQRHGAKPPCVHRQAAANRMREARARAVDASRAAGGPLAAAWNGTRTNQGEPMCQKCQGAIRWDEQGHGKCPCSEWNKYKPIDKAPGANSTTTEPSNGGTTMTSPQHYSDTIYRQDLGAEVNTNTPPSNGGTTMSAGTVDLVDYNTAVNEHTQALEHLNAQLGEAHAFEQHVTGLLAAVEAMDARRGEVTAALAPLSEGLEASRYGGDATQGSAEATAALTAGSIAEVQENIEAAAQRNEQWKAELAASIEGVQASLQHIKSQYGEAAATVQETGIDARALEEH